MKALYLNCSLKPGNETSNTAALIGRSREILEAEGVETEEIRVADYPVAFGMEPDMGDGDAWPAIFRKVREAAILVLGSPIWLGEKSSVATLTIERLYACSGETNDRGQSVYYNKTGGALITGNEDGGKTCARSILYALQHIGFTVPPNADAYWVGEAGPGPSYIEAGQENEFTRKNTRMMTYNLLHFARLLRERPIPPQGNVQQD